MALIDDFKAAFPEFDATVVSNTLPRLVLRYPVFYNVLYSAVIPAPRTNTSILLLLAHLLYLTINSSGAQINQFSSTAVGNVSASFNVPVPTSDFESFFNATSYGQQYLLSIRGRVGAFFV